MCAGSKTLVLGGTASGKSAYAEALLAGGPVRYLATARPHPHDPDFAARIDRHRRRRPQDWVTVEGADPVQELRQYRTTATDAATPILLDDVGMWLTAQLDARMAWDSARGTIAPDTDALVAAIAEYPHRLVIVSPEVGWGVIPATRSGRLFRDELGLLNQRLAQVCTEAVLIVAGRPLTLA